MLLTKEISTNSKGRSKKIEGKKNILKTLCLTERESLEEELGKWLAKVRRVRRVTRQETHGVLSDKGK